MSEKLQNWARSFEYGAERIHAPESETELQEIVRRSSKAKALGTRHSFSVIADCSGDMISTEKLNRVLHIDREALEVRVQAGIRYGELCRALDAEGLALHNLASLPHISVAGACATSTHGSGVKNGSLSTSVKGVRFVAADGSIVAVSRADGDVFLGVVVGLGALGVVTELTLDVEPSFSMTQTVYDNLPFAQLESHFDTIMSSAYSVSLFTHWSSDVVDQIWVKRRETDSELDLTRFGAALADAKRTPLPDGAVQNCTDQLGEPGPSWDRLPHFRLGFIPSSGEELQAEYFVAREHAWEALKVVNGIRNEVAPLLLTTEVRTIAADTFWMSPCFERDSVAIHFTWKKEPAGVYALLPKIESLLAPFDPRPHWGKICTMPSSTIRSLYPRIEAFRELANSYDPDGKFRNSFLDNNVFE